MKYLVNYPFNCLPAINRIFRQTWLSMLHARGR